MSRQLKPAFNRAIHGVIQPGLPMQRSGNDLERVCAELAAYQAAFDHHALFEVVDPAGNITRVNDLFCQISGYSRAELLGLNHRLLQSGRHDRAFWDELWSVVGRGGVWHGEICNRAKDGSLFWVDTTIVPDRDADDHVVQYFVIRTDVTARKQAAAALAVARRNAIDTSRARSDLLAQAGHALRAPLTAMLGYVDLLRDSAAAGELPSSAVQYIDSLGRSAPQLLALLNNLIDLARVDAGKLALAPAEVDLRALLADLVVRLAGTAGQRGVEVRLEAPAGAEMLRTDPDRVAQIVSTLVERAVGWMVRGTVRIGLSRIVQAGAGGGLEIQVADDGPGLAPGTASRLFDPVDPAGSQAAGADPQRLNLYLCQRLAMLLGGEIAVQGDPNSGTTFRLRLRPLAVEAKVARLPPPELRPAGPGSRPGSDSLPAPPVTDPPVHAGKSRSGPEGKRSRVLVVDDDPQIHELVERHLRDFGVLLQHADGGAEALAMALASPPDLIVLDADMHSMDGLETIRRLRQSKTLESVPVILLTGSADDELEVQAFRNGAADFLRKPFKPAVLRARVRAVMQTQALRDLLQREALHDRLTGLPNRALIQGRLGDAVAMKRADPGRDYALLFLDFDRFKLLNDTLGHEAGDELLRQIAQRMRSVTRVSDAVLPGATAPITARLGGDEFVVLLEGLSAPQDAVKVAERLLHRLSEEFEVRGTHVVSTASIGIVLGDAAYGSAIEVLRDADAAMYEAKAAGRGRCVVFDSTMRARVEDRVKLERDLRNALERQELFLEYQPIVSLRSGRLEGIEALLRWSHPQRGRIPPGEFVQLAEETGLISPIGEWALQRACLDFLALDRAMGEHAPRSVSVNVSRQQLGTRDFPGRVRAILEQTRMSPTALRIEVTENGIMRDPEQAVRVLRALRELGIGVHVDDFGTGSSSLACLHQFPVDTLKIDRSFIANSGETAGIAALLHAIVQMARTLGIGVVAEGIETPEQLLLLQSIDCELGQGYLLGRPMPVEAVVAYRRETPPALVMPAESLARGCAA